jgi:cell division protein FtsA
MEEILLMAKDKVEKAGFLQEIRGGIILTGGGAQLDGLADLVESVFNVPAHVGIPRTVGGLGDEYRTPSFATALGLVMLEADEIVPPQAIASQSGTRKERKHGSSLKNLASWFKDKFV